MMAAATAASQGLSVTLLEKNEKLGKKLYITGKGRCNLTNDTDIPGLISQVISNPRFLHSAFHALDSAALISFIENLGVPLKTERGGRVFPVSDKANDINHALEAHLKATGVKVMLNCTVQDIRAGKDNASTTNDDFEVIYCRQKKSNFTPLHNHNPTQPHTATAQALIIATGGLSYPSTGSTGDGYTWGRALGHTIIPTSPSLVPLKAKEPWLPSLAGLSLKNVKCTLSIKPNRTILFEELGEMLFTPTGITGPLILSASAYLAGKPDADPIISIDLKPGLTPAQLDARLLRDFDVNKNKDFCNALEGLLPQRLINTIITLSEIPPDKKVHTITKPQRQRLVHLLKHLEIRPTGNAGYKEAVITTGGISTKEVSPKTLMSKQVPGLFFAGEILDVDALTGGYNMQIAFSTGYLAGLSAVSFLTNLSHRP